MDEFINNVIMGILNPIIDVFEAIFNLIFSSQTSTYIFAFLFINLIGFALMYLDKKYAKEEKRRIKESTFFIVSILFGSLGTLAGMYRFRHKTLHKKFTIGIPLIIAFQVGFVIYSLIKG